MHIHVTHAAGVNLGQEVALLLWAALKVLLQLFRFQTGKSPVVSYNKGFKSLRCHRADPSDCEDVDDRIRLFMETHQSRLYTDLVDNYKLLQILRHSLSQFKM